MMKGGKKRLLCIKKLQTVKVWNQSVKGSHIKMYSVYALLRDDVLTNNACNALCVLLYTSVCISQQKRWLLLTYEGNNLNEISFN